MPGSARKPSSVSGNRPPCCSATALRAGVQIARAGVIAEPGPGLQHVVERRRGERLHIRPARQEFRVIRPDRLHGGLLQHDLRQPDVIGIGPLARRGAPRQMAAMPVVPGEQRRGIGRVVHTAPRVPSRFFRTAAACYPHASTRFDRAQRREQAPPHPQARRTHIGVPGRRFKKQGFASTELVTRWKDIVGAEIAAHAEPVKLQWPREVDGEPAEPATLVLRVEGPAAIEIQHQSAVILERVNRFFGWQAVGRIALRQAPLSRPQGQSRAAEARCRRGRARRGHADRRRRRRAAGGARPARRRGQRPLNRAYPAFAGSNERDRTAAVTLGEPARQCHIAGQYRGRIEPYGVFR